MGRFGKYLTILILAITYSETEFPTVAMATETKFGGYDYKSLEDPPEELAQVSDLSLCGQRPFTNILETLRMSVGRSSVMTASPSIRVKLHAFQFTTDNVTKKHEGNTALHLFYSLLRSCCS